MKSTDVPTSVYLREMCEQGLWLQQLRTLRSSLGTRSAMKMLKIKRSRCLFLSTSIKYYSHSEISYSYLIYLIMHFLSLSIYLALLHPIYASPPSCREVDNRTCNPACGARSCQIEDTDKPSCPRGQQLLETNKSKEGCTEDGYCTANHTNIRLKCTWGFSCVCFLVLDSFLGSSCLTKQKLTSSSVRDNGRACLSLSRVSGCGFFFLKGQVEMEERWR